MIDTTQEDPKADWEGEGGATPEPKQRTPEGLEIPVPKRRNLADAFRKLIRPVKRG
jgi:hypothetical protein